MVCRTVEDVAENSQYAEVSYSPVKSYEWSELSQIFSKLHVLGVHAKLNTAGRQ
jgi:hypothetical protein